MMSATGILTFGFDIGLYNNNNHFGWVIFKTDGKRQSATTNILFILP